MELYRRAREMHLQIIDGYITGWAVRGFFEEGVEVSDDALEGLDADALAKGCYRWEREVAVLDGEKLRAVQAASRAGEIRAQRIVECWPIVNRGPGWYARLTDEQRAELDAWYQAWLDAPATGIVPNPLEWLK
jgi:hypothetical protein